jgi:NAD(P)-dependent dehydrogenase (short-subunit alcohol dehydrogenase family)
LHANAGVLGESVAVGSLDAEAFDRIVAVNLRGAFLTLRELLRRRSGPVPPAAVLTASTAGHRAYAGYGAYAASKHAVLGLVRAAARDHGPEGVRVNAVSPGAMATEMARRVARDISGSEPSDFAASPGMAEQIAEIPLGRMADPNDVAAVVAWLLSDEARQVNGASYVVDGGVLA